MGADFDKISHRLTVDCVLFLTWCVTPMALGYVALVLHAHLPFVRHPESDYVLEEEWLYEAIQRLTYH